MSLTLPDALRARGKERAEQGVEKVTTVAIFRVRRDSRESIYNPGDFADSHAISGNVGDRVQMAMLYLGSNEVWLKSPRDLVGAVTLSRPGHYSVVGGQNPAIAEPPSIVYSSKGKMLRTRCNPLWGK